MSRIPLPEIVSQEVFVCPKCRAGLRFSGEEGDGAWFRCEGCKGEYPVAGGIPSFLPGGQDQLEDVQEFWKTLYEEVYKARDENLSREVLVGGLDDLLDMFHHRCHLATVEMPLDQLKGKRILEVGCGAGAHSALFSRLGAEVYSLDLTMSRVAATASKLDALEGTPKDLALQGDAGALPFRDGFFDIVYSNGVLHHTPYIEKTVEEIFRVLKPGGLAVVMLYAKNSFLYRGVLFPVRGILMGGVFRNSQWLGHFTEWMSSRKQHVFNPHTELFSGREIRYLFRQFSDVRIRKNSFHLEQLPVLGKGLGKVAGRWSGYNPGGNLVYGMAWRNETRLELWLGKFIGFDLNICAVK